MCIRLVQKESLPRLSGGRVFLIYVFFSLLKLSLYLIVRSVIIMLPIVLKYI
jgi:hypothetical protein